MINSSQGTRDAGTQWYNLVVNIFVDYGFMQSTVDKSLFIKTLDTFDPPEFLAVGVQTDDFCTAGPNSAIIHDFIQYLQQYFVLSIKTGGVLKFNGIRITQSDIGISIDQSEYILELLTKHFGRLPDKIKTLSTPMRYASKFEQELTLADPLSTDELKKVAIEMNGSFRYHTGSWMFATQTRFDLLFPTQRLSKFNTAPNQVAFDAIKRIYRYVAGRPHVPITYPRQSLNGTTDLKYMVTPNNYKTLTIPNFPCNFNDAELGRCFQTRQAYYCVMIVINSVIVYMKIRTTEAPMLHTTDSELKANLEGAKELIPARELCQFLGVVLDQPSTMYMDNRAVHEIVQSGRITPRVKHASYPIAFLQHYNNIVFKLVLIPTDVMLADMGTKPNTPAVLQRFISWATGAQFLPPKDHIHYKLLQLHFYDKSFHEIMHFANSNS